MGTGVPTRWQQLLYRGGLGKTSLSFLRTLGAAAVRRGRKGLSNGATPEVSPERVRE